MRDQPKVVILEREYEHGSIQLIGDIHARGTGVLTPNGKLRRNAPKHAKEQLQMWRIIQKERARLGLPPLTADEMLIRP